MNPKEAINRAIAELMAKTRLSDKEIAKKLTEKAEKKVSPQRLGLYKNNKRQPGADFILLWQEVFGDNIYEVAKQIETNVSRETKVDRKHTHGGEPAVKQKKPLPDEEREILIESLKQFGETNAYLLKRIKELGG